MKITLLLIGKTSFDFVAEGISLYYKRIIRYIPFEIIEIPDAKCTSSTPVELVKEREYDLLMKRIKPNDYVILLDEKGKMYSSIEWSRNIEDKLISGSKNIIFVVGGAGGFSKKMYERGNELLSLSKMTYSHQIIRLFFAEQLYRAFTIIKGEPYHNE